MPEGKYNQNYKFLKESDWLSFDEIIHLVKIFSKLGVKKIRITGGEPLLRPDLDSLITRITHIKGIEDISLTTNGSLLSAYAESLKKSGLKRLTVSLDSLDKDVYREMNGGRGNVHAVLDGIKAATEAGFESLKINVVVERGRNDHTIIDLVKYIRTTPHILRFIEYMDVGTCNEWSMDRVVSSKEILNLIKAEFPLEPVNPNYFGEVAKRYRFKDGKGEIGFISSVTENFCGKCTRARLSTDGKLYTCLFANKGHDLKGLLNNNSSNEEISRMIQDIWKKREDRYSELRSDFIALKNPPEKVEMFHIGG